MRDVTSGKFEAIITVRNYDPYNTKILSILKVQVGGGQGGKLERW